MIIIDAFIKKIIISVLKHIMRISRFSEPDGKIFTRPACQMNVKASVPFLRELQDKRLLLYLVSIYRTSFVFVLFSFFSAQRSSQ